VSERTAAIAEALHCHCPVVLLTHRGFTYEAQAAFYGGHGLVWGFDRAGFIRATASAPEFAAHYAAQFVDADAQVLKFVADARRYFGLQARHEAAA
jgi:hypothetical protein